MRTDVAFQVQSSGTINPLTEHGLPITTFVSLLNAKRTRFEEIPECLRLDILAGITSSTSMVKQGDFEGGYDGIITIDIARRLERGGYFEAILQKMEYHDNHGEWILPFVRSNAVVKSRP
jgi:hypothetical protein